MFSIYLIICITADLVITVENNLLVTVGDIWRPLLVFVLLFACCIIIHAIGISALSLFAPKGKSFGRFDNFFRRVTIETIDFIMKVVKAKVHVTGIEKLPENERFLLVGNHRSVFDPMIEMSVLRDCELAFVSKKENINLPFFGRLMLASGCLALDRENNREAVKTIMQASKRLSEDCCSMGIYPEGGINKTENVLLPFHNGSFKIAKKAGAPLVISTIRNTERLCKRFFLFSTDIYLDIIEVIPAEEVAQMTTAQLSDIAYSVMYDHLCSRVIPDGNTESEGARVSFR